jgi:hypothetical protein
VYATGEPFVAHEIPSAYDRGNGPEVTYVDAILQPLRDDDGKINGLALFVIDVTDKVGLAGRTA